MFAERNVDRGVTVEHRQLFVGYRPGEHEPIRQQPVLRHQRANHRIIPRHHVEAADEDEAVIGVDVALVELGKLDVIFDLLVRRNAADEQKIHQPVVEDPVERRAPGCAGDPGGVDGDRKHRRAREAKPLQLAAVVFRVAEREVDRVRKGRQLPPSQHRQTEQRRIERREIVGGRDVVVLQDADSGQPGKRVGHRRRERVMEHRDLPLPGRRVGERPHVARQVVIDGQGKQIAFMTHRAQEAANAAGAVADGVAAMRGRHPLIHDHGATGSAL